MRRKQLCYGFVAGLAMLQCIGCATWDSAKQKLSNLSLRQNAKRPWQREPDSDVDPFGERNPGRMIAQDLAPRNLASTLKIKTRFGQNRERGEALFREAMQLYNDALAARDAGKQDPAAFNRAANKFREAAASWPESSTEHDALFMQGEAYFFADEYVSSNRAYELLLSRYSGTRYLDQVESRRFSIAQYWLSVADKRDGFTEKINFNDKRIPTRGFAASARQILHSIRLDDPTGKLSDDATIALGDAYFRSKNFVEAAEAYRDLRTSYPGSPHQFRAHLFELKSLMQTYQGNSYDGQPLVESDKLIRNMLRLFPKQAEEHQEYLAREASTVRNLLADRELSLAKFYEGKGENRAASFYYEQVAKNFSDTPLATEAGERFAALTGAQAKPDQHAEWLVKLFPETKKSKPLIATKPSDTINR